MPKYSSENLQTAANRIEKQLTSPTVTLILAAACLGAIFYMSYLLRPEYRGDTLPYFMVIIAEVFIITQGLISFWTILSGRFNPRNFEFHHSQDRLFSAESAKTTMKVLSEQGLHASRNLAMYLHGRPITVDVFITVYGEAVRDVRQTARAARDMYGLHQTYILDDGKSDEVLRLAEELGIQYIRRPHNNHAKAGNVNYALGMTGGDLFVILDADFVASKDFLYETVPFFENSNLAFVQTPQYYDNQNNFVSIGASFMQHVFYSLIQAGKNRFNSAFCVGTNVIFRRSAIEAIGGMYIKSKSEDIWTSLTLHEEGYESIYISKVLAVGKTPETIKAYAKQQLRWATGSFEIFLRHNPLFSRKLTVDQRLQYFGTTSYYFTGFAVLLLLLLPALQIFFNITPIALGIPVWQWALMYSGFYLTQLILAFYTMGGFKFETLMLASASFPIYVKAFFNALFKKDQAWQATNSVSYDSPFNYVRVQVYVFIFLLLTTIIGIWKGFYTDEFSISIVWNALNTIIFGYFFWAAVSEVIIHRKKSKPQSATNRLATTGAIHD